MFNAIFEKRRTSEYFIKMPDPKQPKIRIHDFLVPNFYAIPG